MCRCREWTTIDVGARYGSGRDEEKLDLTAIQFGNDGSAKR
jgi:hypothetical protein